MRLKHLLNEVYLNESKVPVSKKGNKINVKGKTSGYFLDDEGDDGSNSYAQFLPDDAFDQAIDLLTVPIIKSLYFYM